MLCQMRCLGIVADIYFLKEGGAAVVVLSLQEVKALLMLNAFGIITLASNLCPKLNNLSIA